MIHHGREQSSTKSSFHVHKIEIAIVIRSQMDEEMIGFLSDTEMTRTQEDIRENSHRSFDRLKEVRAVFHDSESETKTEYLTA